MQYSLKPRRTQLVAWLTLMTLLFSLLWAVAPKSAWATNTVGDKTTTLTINLNDNGNVTTAAVLSIGDLQNMTQRHYTYSTINNATNVFFYATEGVLLTDILAAAHIDPANIDKLKFTATDDYNRTFTKQYCMDTTRYFYPNINNNYSTQGGIPVQPILALKSQEVSDQSQLDLSKASDYYSARLFFGQTDQDLISNQSYVKWVSKIELYTKPLSAQSPSLIADTVNNTTGQAITLNYIDNQAWRNAITDITVDGNSIIGNYSVAAGTITIDGSVLTTAKDYAVVVKSDGYQDATVTQHKGPWSVLMTVDGNSVTAHSFTAPDLRAMPATTFQFGMETCKGVALKDLLTTLNISDPSWQVQINVTDAATYHIDPVSVASLLDQTNKYLLTYDIDGQPITIGPNNQTPLRINWGLGVVYKNVTGITISKTPQNLAQNNGVGLETLTPDAVGLVIGGSGITKGTGLLGNFIYLSQAQVDNIKATKSLSGLDLGNSWTSAPTLYSSYDNHGVPEYVYTLAEGINLKTALTALGVDVTSAPVAIEATGSDAYSKIVDDAFGKTSSRNYIAPDGTVGATVDPILIFYDNRVTTQAPDSSTVVPTTTVAIANSNPLFAFGQKTPTEQSNCNFINNTVKIRAGIDTPAFTVTKDSMTKSISLSDLALAGIYQTSYSWANNGTQVTQSLKGVPLSAVLTKLGMNVPSDKGLVINVNDGSGPAASSRTISYNEISKCFVAFDAFENSQRVSGSIKPLRLYCPGETQASVLIENMVGASVSDVTPSYTVGFEENGGSAITDITQASGTTIATAPVSTKAGYTLEGWYIDQALTTSITFPYMVTGNTTLYAKWTALTAYAKGDVNCDNNVNILDVVLTVNFALSKTTPTSAQLSAADYNDDSIVNILDVVQIVNKALGY